MRIGFGITMSRKMFGTGKHSSVLHSFCILHSKFGYPIAVFTKTAIVDYRIFRVVVDINIRCKIDMDSHALALIANCYTHLISDLFVSPTS